MQSLPAMRAYIYARIYLIIPVSFLKLLYLKIPLASFFIRTYSGILVLMAAVSAYPMGFSF
jgi:hypothetical protein